LTDRRFHKANNRVAHSSLTGRVEDVAFSEGTAHSVHRPATSLYDQPGGGRDKVMLYGQRFVVLDVHNGWAFGFDPADDYVGYIAADHLGPMRHPTHRIKSRLSHAYAAPNIKERECALLSFGAEISGYPENDSFFAIPDFSPCGRMCYVPLQDIGLISDFGQDPASIAELFLGTPYLWGSNTGTGMDCSGLVQVALRACNIKCPRDSDQQQAAFHHISFENRCRGDLIFWKGHVGMLLDPETLLHANAYHMAVAIEPLEQGITRIAQQEFGSVTAYARPS